MTTSEKDPRPSSLSAADGGVVGESGPVGPDDGSAGPAQDGDPGVPVVADELGAVVRRLSELARQLVTLEATLLEAEDPDVGAALHRLRRDLRRTERMLGEPLDGGSYDPAEEGERERLRRRAADGRAAARELSDLQQAMTARRQLEATRMLIVLGAVFLPLVVLAGVYGMNFSAVASPWNMPELRAYWGYPLVLGCMVVLALGLLLAFRRRGWLGRRRG